MPDIETVTEIISRKAYYARVPETANIGAALHRVEEKIKALETEPTVDHDPDIVITNVVVRYNMMQSEGTLVDESASNGTRRRRPSRGGPRSAAMRTILRCWSALAEEERDLLREQLAYAEEHREDTP